MLANPAIPEDAKIELRLMNALDKLNKRIISGFHPYIKPLAPGEYRQQLLPLRQELLEYIRLMELSLNTFPDTHPLPEKAE